MRPMEAGSTAWAQGDPPRVRGPWEAAIIELAEAGDPRFVRILHEHWNNRVIRSERARKALFGDQADAAAA